MCDHKGNPAQKVLASSTPVKHERYVILTAKALPEVNCSVFEPLSKPVFPVEGHA